MGTATEYSLRQIRAVLLGHSVWETAGVVQILAYNASLGEIEELYTVPAGKVGYLTSVYVYGRNNHANEQIATVEVQNDVEVAQVDWPLTLPAGEWGALVVPVSVPIKMGAGWRVIVWSSAFDNYAYASITGYELPE